MHILIFLFLFLLTGCSSVEERQMRVRNLWGVLFEGGIGLTEQTQEGFKEIRDGMEGAVEVGKGIVEGVGQTVESINTRVKKVQKGMTKLQEGRVLIEEGVLE